MLNINKQAENGKLVIALEGRLDTTTAPPVLPEKYLAVFYLICRGLRRRDATLHPVA